MFKNSKSQKFYRLKFGRGPEGDPLTGTKNGGGDRGGGHPYMGRSRRSSTLRKIIIRKKFPCKKGRPAFGGTRGLSYRVPLTYVEDPHFIQ